MWSAHYLTHVHSKEFLKIILCIVHLQLFLVYLKDPPPYNNCPLGPVQALYSVY